MCGGSAQHRYFSPTVTLALCDPVFGMLCRPCATSSRRSMGMFGIHTDVLRRERISCIAFVLNRRILQSLSTPSARYHSHIRHMIV